MKWVEKKIIVELFFELLSDNSVWGYYYHCYPDLNQNKWFIKGKIIKCKKKFFIELTEPEWFSCKEYEYVKITNKKVCDYLKNIKIVEINNLRNEKVL